MPMQEWPPEERPQERLIRQGAESLSDAELLAVLLRHGLPGGTAVDLARGLLSRSGGLRQLLAASLVTVSGWPGLGPARFAQLQAIREIARRCLAQQLDRGDVIDSPQATRRYLKYWLRDAPRERFVCLFLDNRHRVISCESLFEGTIDGASVYPREVVRCCIERRAAAVIFAHNHPSGVSEPSDADRRITRRLCDALALIDVRVLDHLVIGDGETTSFAERGLI